MTSELISLLANLALTLSLIVAVVFGIAQVRAAARDRRENLTLETLRTFESREFAELLYYIDSHAMPSTRKELRALPADEQIMFTQFAQQMEALGILVAERIIDLDLVDKTLGSFVSDSWEKYRPLVVHTREHETEPYFSEYFQWLAELIDERLRKYPRTPFHETHERR
jgi:hypothetical protein